MYPSARRRCDTQAFSVLNASRTDLKSGTKIAPQRKISFENAIHPLSTYLPVLPGGQCNFLDVFPKEKAKLAVISGLLKVVTSSVDYMK